MKSVISLVVILHLCYSCYSMQRIRVSPLKTEMILGLTGLNDKLKSDNYPNTTTTVYMPSKYMFENPGLCAGLFIRELRVILCNLPERYNDSVTMLLANLNTAKPFPVNTKECKMANKTSRNLPIENYKNFIRKLNIQMAANPSVSPVSC